MEVLKPYQKHIKKLVAFDFRSRWLCRKTQLFSSHNHIKITTKLHNNHYSELPEIELNGSPTTMQSKNKPH